MMMMMVMVMVMGGDRLESSPLNYGYRYYLQYPGEGEGGLCLCQIRQGRVLGYCAVHRVLSSFALLLAYLFGVHPFNLFTTCTCHTFARVLC